MRTLGLGPTQDVKATAEDNKEEVAQRLAFMKESLSVYDIYVGHDRKTKLALRPEPLLRFSNPVSSVPDGAVFMWTANGRPEIGMQVFIAAGSTDLWLHEFQSLSTGVFTVDRDGQTVWHPQALKDGPDKLRAVRLRVQSLARLSSAELTARLGEREVWRQPSRVNLSNPAEAYYSANEPMDARTGGEQ